MNIQLPEVLADVPGVTGLAILRAIVAGERRGDVLARLRQPGCRHTEPDIIAALTGTWRDEYVDTDLSRFDQQALLLLARAGAPQRHFRWQGPALAPP